MLNYSSLLCIVILQYFVFVFVVDLDVEMKRSISVMLPALIMAIVGSSKHQQCADSKCADSKCADSKCAGSKCAGSKCSERSVQCSFCNMSQCGIVTIETIKLPCICRHISH